MQLLHWIINQIAKFSKSKESRLNFSLKDNCFTFCDQIETAKECSDVKHHWKHRFLVSNTKYPCDQGFLRNCTRSWLWSDAKYRSAEEHRPRVPRGLLPKLSSQSLTFNFRLDLQLSSQLLQSNFWLSPHHFSPLNKINPLNIGHVQNRVHFCIGPEIYSLPLLKRPSFIIAFNLISW